MRDHRDASSFSAFAQPHTGRGAQRRGLAGAAYAGSTGCARSRILIDTEDANAFLIASEWSDHDAAEAFFTSREFQIFRGVRILMRDEPLIVLDDVRSRITRLLRN